MGFTGAAALGPPLPVCQLGEGTKSAVTVGAADHIAAVSLAGASAALGAELCCYTSGFGLMEYTLCKLVGRL